MKYFNKYIFSMYSSSQLICRITTCWEFLYFFGLCGRFLVVGGQNRAVLVASVICFQKMYGFHGINHQIFNTWRTKKSDDGQRDRQTNRISFFKFNPFCRRGRVKTCRCLAAQKNEVGLMPQSQTLQKNIRNV